MNHDQARAIEEASLNAWPAVQQLVYDGWLLRFGGGYSRRANSVNPLYAGSVAVPEKIARCEQIYREQQLAPTFRITPFIQPADLEDALARRGYEKQSPTSVQTLDLTDFVVQPSDAIRQWTTPAEAWLAQYVRMNQVSAEKKPALRAILNHILSKACFALLLHRQRAAACGLGVVEGSFVGLFDIVTDPVQRGQGFGLKLLHHLLGWARQQEATTAYLQVVADNEPALRLYHKLGFREAYRYWYRVKRGA